MKVDFFVNSIFNLVFLGKVYDNALAINDYSDFNVFINNERYSTEVGGDDGKWHHIAVSWASSTGNVIFYKDGSAVSRGTIQQNKVSFLIIIRLLHFR